MQLFDCIWYSNTGLRKTNNTWKCFEYLSENPIIFEGILIYASYLKTPPHKKNMYLMAAKYFDEEPNTTIVSWISVNIW